MINKISAYTVGEFLRFAVVGVVATGIHYGIYYLLQQTIPAGVAYTVGYVVSFVINFALTTLFTFRTQASVKKGFGFCLAHLCNYLLQMVLLYVFLSVGVAREIAPIPVYCIVVPVTFLMVRFVFRHNKK